MTTKELTNYRPYNVGRYHDGYADIVFQDEGIMTIPKNSAQTIVDFMNEAFKNGVKMTLKTMKPQTNTLTSNFDETPMIKPQSIPQEELHPIYSKIKK